MLSILSSTHQMKKTVTSISSYDGTIRFWDAATGAPLKTIAGHTGSFGRAVAFSPDGTTLANVGTGDNTIPIRDVQSRQLLRTLTGHTDIVASVAYSPDGRNLVSADWDGNIRIWDCGDRTTRKNTYWTRRRCSISCLLTERYNTYKWELGQYHPYLGCGYW